MRPGSGTNRKARRAAAATARATLAAAKADMRKRVQQGKLTAGQAQAIVRTVKMYAAKHPANATRRGRVNSTNPATARTTGSVARATATPNRQGLGELQPEVCDALEVPGAGRSQDQTATVAPASGPSGPP